MPLSGGKYVAPHWVNGGPPALDAAELQAICDTVVKNQGDSAELQKAVETLTNAVGGRAKVIRGSYIGTGNYGQDNRTKISFPLGFVPQAIFVAASSISSYAEGGFAWVRGETFGKVVSPTGSHASNGCKIEWGQSTVSWYDSGSSSYQLNKSGVTYFYLAIS